MVYDGQKGRGGPGEWNARSWSAVFKTLPYDLFSRNLHLCIASPPKTLHALPHSPTLPFPLPCPQPSHAAASLKMLEEGTEQKGMPLFLCSLLCHSGPV